MTKYFRLSWLVLHQAVDQRFDLGRRYFFDNIKLAICNSAFSRMLDMELIYPQLSWKVKS